MSALLVKLAELERYCMVGDNAHKPGPCPGPEESKPAEENGKPAGDWQPSPSPDSFIQARNKSTRPGFLSALDPQDLSNHKLFLSKDGTCGVALSPEGDIQNLFNNGGPKGAATNAILAAIHAGGHTLDCFSGYLPDLYSQFGFVETGRMKFNRDYAPDKWDYNKYDDPDVVFMNLANKPGNDDETRKRVADKEHWTDRKKSDRYYQDFDQAKADSRRTSNHQSHGEGRRPRVGGSSRGPNSRSSSLRRRTLKSFSERFAELERYCMEGPNKGKPGPCPEDSHPTGALDTMPSFLKPSFAKPKEEKKPSEGQPQESPEHEHARSALHVAADALDAGQEIFDTVSATGGGFEGPARILGDFTLKSIPPIKRAIVKYHEFILKRYGEVQASRIMAFGIAASLVTEIPLPALHALPLSEYFHSVPALAFAEFCLKTHKCGPLEKVMVRLNDFKNRIPGHAHVGKAVTKTVHGYRKLKGLAGHLTRKAIGKAAQGAAAVGRAAAPQYGRAAVPTFAEDADSVLVQKEGKKFAKYIQSVYGNFLIQNEKKIVPAAKALAGAMAIHRMKKLAKYCEWVPWESFAENASLPNQQIFTTGMHRGKVYNHRDLDQMVANWKVHSSGDNPKLRIPAVIGHEESQDFLDNSGIPAAGWVSGLRNVKAKCGTCGGEGKVGGDSGPGTCPRCAGTGISSTLYADFDEVPRQVAKLLNRKAYRTVSSEVYDRPPEGIPGEGKVLRRVAFLGGEIPQIKSLNEIGSLYEHSEKDATYLRSGMPTTLLLTRIHKPWPKRKRTWHTCFSEVRAMSREEMIAKLTKDYGFNREVLDKAPDETLAEILRVYDSQGGGEGEEEMPVGEEDGMGGGAGPGDEELPVGEEQPREGDQPPAEELGEQEHSLLGKIGEQPRGGETPAGHIDSATQDTIQHGEDGGQAGADKGGDDGEFQLPEPKTPEEAKKFAAYAQKAFKRASRAVQKYCGKKMGETLNSGDTGMLSGPEHAHTDPDEPEKAGYNLPAAGGNRQPKKVSMSATYSEQEKRLRSVIRQEVSALLKSGLQRDVADLQKFREEVKIGAKEEAVAAILQRNKRKILPVQVEMFRELLMGADCRVILQKFREKNGSVRDITRFDQIVAKLDSMPDLLLEKFSQPFDQNSNGPSVETWAEQTYTKHSAAFKKMGGMTKADFIVMAKKADSDGTLQKFREQWDQAPVQAA